jgi:hypothetical protein
MSFEGKSMQYMLSDNFESHFNSEYPLFYKNKIRKSEGKYYYRSALDNALRNNQIKSIELIISYIVKYQNVYSSSFLFRKNFE